MEMFYISIGFFIWMIICVAKEEMDERKENKEVEEHVKNGTLPFI